MGLRVLIIDGHPAVGRGLAALLGAMPDLVVVGVASCPARGLWQAVRTPPDIALVDAELPGLCSSAVIRLLRVRSPETRLVALGVYPERRAAALEAGAHAFLLKDAGYEALRAAICDGSAAICDGSQEVHTSVVKAPRRGTTVDSGFGAPSSRKGAVAEEMPSR